MKKVLGVAAIAAMFAASTAMAATLEVRVVTTGSTTVGNSELVDVLIEARLDGGGAATSDGLALIGTNLKASGDFAVDLCDTAVFLVESTPAMANFDRIDPATDSFTNLGLTNPRAEAPMISGYSGTCDGANGLWQIGGGQNTIGNTVAGAPYPIGPVSIGVGNGGWVVIAEGSILTPDTGDGDIVLTLDTVFANTIDVGQASAPYSVTEVATGDITVTPLTLTIGGTIMCADADVNCDGSVNGLDIAAVKAPGTWLQPTGSAGNPRGDVNLDGAVNGLDIAAVKAPGTWLTSTGPCTCP